MLTGGEYSPKLREHMHPGALKNIKKVETGKGLRDLLTSRITWSSIPRTNMVGKMKRKKKKKKINPHKLFSDLHTHV